MILFVLAVALYSKGSYASLWALDECQIALESDEERIKNALALANELFEGPSEAVIADFQRSMAVEGYAQLKILPSLMEKLTAISELIMKDRSAAEVTLVAPYIVRGALNIEEALGVMQDPQQYEPLREVMPEMYASIKLEEEAKQRLALILDISPLIIFSHKLSVFFLRGLPEVKHGFNPLKTASVQLRVRTDDEISDHIDENYITASLNFLGRGTHSPKIGVNSLHLFVFTGSYRAKQQSVPATLHGGRSDPGMSRANLFLQFDPM